MHNVLNLTAALPGSQRVSILLPVFNTAQFVAEAIESVLGQTYPALELVIQDGGSRDGSQQICAWYATRDSRIRLLPPFPQNRGRIAARNALLAACHGDYVAWLDSDDVCAPERIERQVSFLCDNPAIGGVGSGVHFTDVAMRVLRTETLPPTPPKPNANLRLSSATLMATRAAVYDVGAFHESLAAGCAEQDWLLRIAERHTITNLGTPLYYRRLREPSVTHAGPMDGGFAKLARFRPWARLLQPIKNECVAPRHRHTLRVAVHEGWGDFEDSLKWLTTIGDGRWGPVLFGPASAIHDADYHLVLNSPRADID